METDILTGEESTSDPKNRSASQEEKIVNRQDDNSYEEANQKKNTNQAEGTGKKQPFEYRDGGEFTNDAQLNDTNDNDEYL